jgi:hypothetical protein
MKKLILIPVIFAVMSGGLAALDLFSYPSALEGGDILVDVAIGYASALGFSGSGTTLKIPPVSAGVEYALKASVPISVGGMAAFWRYGWDYYNYGYTWTYIVGGARANWHWNFDIPWLDAYTGLLIGYRYFKEDYDGPQGSWYTAANYGGFTYGVQAGAHFYFSNKIGALAEVGYPFLIKAGLALKF